MSGGRTRTQTSAASSVWGGPARGPADDWSANCSGGSPATSAAIRASRSSPSSNDLAAALDEPVGV
ncbi:hypothetical protein, partial [Pseudonocardia sp. ICBG1034]|uniref:hypothetical protein n=1 Tax=Pseudonocardia sp. ICBG1034 TaxID=2844381 RepID=UPI001CCBD9C7